MYTSVFSYIQRKYIVLYMVQFLAMLRIHILDPNFFSIPAPGSRVRIKEFKYFNLNNCFLSSRKYDQGCFYPGSESWFFTHPGSRIQGSKRHRIPDPDPQHWFLVNKTLDQIRNDLKCWIGSTLKTMRILEQNLLEPEVQSTWLTCFTLTPSSGGPKLVTTTILCCFVVFVVSETTGDALL